MGLFSSKTRIYTATQTMNLVADTPNVIQQSVVSSLMGNTDIVADLSNTMLNLFKGKVKNYYKYGRDHYTNGLPTGKVQALAVDSTKIYPIIDGLQTPPDGTTLKIISATLDSAYPLTYAVHMYLQDRCEYNATSGKVGENPWVPEGSKVLLSDSKVDYKNKTISIRFTWTEAEIVPGEGPQTVSKYKTITVTPDSLPTENDWFYAVSYIYTNPTLYIVPNEFRYWVYRLGEGTYPTLDTLPSSTLDNQFFPIIPLRLSNKSLTSGSATSTNLYKTSKKLLKKVDLSISELDKGINENPDIGGVDHAYVVMGIDPRSKTPEAAEYLYKFFNNTKTRVKYTYDDFKEWEAKQNDDDDDNQSIISRNSTPPVNIIEFKDGTFKTEINFYYITTSIGTGSMCDVGSYTSTFTGDLYMIEGDGFEYDDPRGGINLYYQINSNTYSHIYVAGLSQTVAMYEAKNHIINLKSDEEEVIVIPLSYDILSTMHNLSSNTLCYESLKIVFHAYEKVKLKWYQTGLFKFVTIVVAVAIAIYSQQWQLVAAAISAGAAAVAVLVAKAVILSIAMKYAFKFVAEKLGVGFAAILAAIAVAYGLAGEMGGLDLPMADSIMAITGPMFEAIGSVQAEQFAALQAEMNQFNADYEAQLEEIKAKWDMLDNGPQLFDPFKIYTAVDMPYFESPSNYIERKTTSNIAELTGYNAVASYVDNALDLTVI